MASQARKAFDQNLKDVEQLLKIHADKGGFVQGRRFGLEVLNKSAIVLITAFWEAYCEDLAAEALKHLVSKARSGSSLPKELKKKLASDIKKDPNDLAMWDLADAGWKKRASEKLNMLMTERNRRLNTPKTAQINELFADSIGLPNISTIWYWKGMSAAQASRKLDDFVDLRGAIAHRGSTASSVRKLQVTEYLGHIKQLVSMTGGHVSTHVETATGRPLW